MFQGSIVAWLNHQQSKSSSGVPVEKTKPSETPVRYQNGLGTYTSQVDAASSPETRSSSVNENLRMPKATIETCTAEHLNALRRLNTLLLPIQYPTSFYKEISSDPIAFSITRVAIWHEQDRPRTASGSHEDWGRPEPTSTEGYHLVAAIRCRLLKDPALGASATTPVLYISTIGTLAPFRGHALASRLLHDVAARAAEEYGVQKITAHVWEANEEALSWYKRRGFQVVNREEKYYQRLAPKTAAWVISRDITTSDVLAWRSRISTDLAGEAAR